VRSFASDGTDIFVTLGGGGIHGSFDNGYNWEGKNTGLLSSDVKVIVYKDSILFTGTDEGVYRSCDNGTTWEPVFNGLRDTYVKSMTVMGNTIFAGTYVHGIFRSTDNGDSWQQIYPPGANYIYFMENNGSRIFAATYGDGMLVSDDNGDTWHVKNNGLTNLGILTVYVDGDLVIVSTYPPGDHFRSFDAGETWSDLSLPYGHSKEMVELNGYIYSAFWGNGVYRSNDNGSTWEARNSGLSTSIWSMEKNGNSLFVGYDNGDIYRSDNYGSSWSNSSAGLVKGAYVGSLQAVVALPEYPQDANKIIACTHGSNLFNSNDEGQTWIQKSVGTVEIRSITSVSRTVIIGTDMLGLFLSGNTSGDSYVAKNNGLGSKWIQSIHVTDRLQGEIFCGTGEAGVYFTTDGCESWTPKNNGLTTGYVKSIIGGNPEMFIGTGDAGVFYTDNYASSWTPRNNGLGSDWIETLIQTDSLLFAGTGDAGVYKSSDNGLNWTPANTGLNDSLFVRNILEHNGTLIACSKPLGVFISRDNGESWQEFNSGLTNKYIASLEIYDGNLYAGSIGDGVFIRPLSDLEVLGTPVNLTITSAVSSSLLNWDEVSGASYYRIYRSEQPYSGFSEIGTSVTTSYEDTNAPGNKYFYRVTADNSK